MDDSRLTALLLELYDEGTYHAPAQPPVMPAKRSSKRPRWVLAAGAVAAAIALTVGVTQLEQHGDTARLIPVQETPATPSPALPTSAASSMPTVPATPLPPDAGDGVLADAGQFHATRWKGVNSWSKGGEAFASLRVYAGGAPTDPTLQRSSDTYAAVLVVSYEDLARFDRGETTLDTLGTSYYPPAKPRGKLQVLSASGYELTLQLVGTSQRYHFNAASRMFD
jgi:hypothetical protein